MSLVAVIEDDEVLAFSIRHSLQRAGYSVQVYADGQRALDVLSQSPGDVVLVDLLLPEEHERGVDNLRRLERGEDVRASVNRFRCKDGSYRWLS